MAEEKIFIINLRREFIKKPLYRRAKKAVTAVKEFIIKHLKVKEVKIGKNLNEKIWERGKRHPPPKVKIKAVVENNIAYVELPEFEFNLPQPKEEKKTKEEKPSETKAEEKKKELQKALAHEEKLKQKKEYKLETIEKPERAVKQDEKKIEDIQKHGRVIGSSGKKGARSPKP